MPTPTRIPTLSDFTPLSPALTVSLAFPSPPESTTSILLLFHGLGDYEAPFAGFAENLALPGVLAISVRGVSPLPPSLLSDNGLDTSGPNVRHFHWGDDITISPTTGELDTDPGFEKAEGLVLGRLVREVLVGKCGWEAADVLMFGFGQGGSLALGLAARVGAEGEAFKGVVSIGGPLPPSMVSSVSGREKARTPVLVLHGKESEAVDEDAVEALRREFEDVREVKWDRRDDGMPRSREEVLPMMQFFAERLKGEGV
ncbi:phospholipase/Carboxylesterase superfamily protein [Bombardia bombarda]|uniref:Phospholipase/Carboxylesterase superfamily protein n=1 Tax=Bombardia bombarda TaxID=252184 RepID=A0AA39XJZ9_9PEZI|nr:phospholipase/Carboxylesterase superfamily protein [Bombardia bombarda]